MTAVLLNAWNMGAQGYRLGHPVTRGKSLLWKHDAIAAYQIGWWMQAHFMKRQAERTGKPFAISCLRSEHFTLLFDMKLAQPDQIAAIMLANRKERMMPTRTADELKALRAEFMNTYEGAAEQADDAFTAHLATLDATSAPAPEAAPAKGKKAKAAKPAKAAKAAKPAKAAKAPKAAAAPKSKAFRPTSEDRKTFNAAAAKVAGKDVKTPRLLPADGKSTYTDFLQGKVLKLDGDGSGTTTLNVVSAKDAATVLGTLTVSVVKGKVSVKGNKN